MAVALLPLTKTQEEVLAFLWSFYRCEDQLPPALLVADYFQYRSKTAVNCVQQALERKGYIEKNTVGKYRFTSLFHAEQLRELVGEETE